LKSVKERLRNVPNKGIDWGLFAYLGDDSTHARARTLPRPWVSFNYLGRISETLPAEGRFGFAREAAGDSMSADSELAHVLELNGMVVDGSLSMSWRYSPGVVDPKTVEHLVASFDAKVRALAAHCASAEPTATASDFAFAGLTQEALEAMHLPLARIQDIYPATPIQQGLIFQSLLHPSRGAYINQLRLTLRGRLDVASLRDAWNSAVARHDILRTHFEWRHGGEAMQVVHREGALPFTEHDWTHEDDYEARLAVWREADIARGFAIDEAPLLRINVFVRPDGAYDLLRTSHHALSDGWSAQQLFAEILAEYGARYHGEAFEPPAPLPYRDYLAWLQARPSARAFWEARFRTADDPATVLLAASRPVAPFEAGGPIEQYLGASLSQRLRACAQRRQVTLNTLVQGAWAIVLGRMGNRRQAIFGATVSGRPPELEGSDRILGPFINSLPVLVDLPPDASLDTWLQRLQHDSSELRQYEYTPLHELQRWVQRTGDALFDSLLVFENFPTDEELLHRDVGLVMEHSELVDRTHYPLTLTIVPNDAELKLEWAWDPEKVARSRVLALSEHYAEVLEQLAADGDRLVGDVRLRPREMGRVDSATPGPISPLPLRGRVGVGAPVSSLGERIAEQTRARPQAEAVSCEGERLTYDELERFANRIGRKLLEIGADQGERIGVCVDRSTALIAACLGTWKVGAAYVPLDPSYPEERLRAIVTGAGIRRVVADAESAKRAARALEGSTLVVLSELDAVSDEPLRRHVHPDQLAYVIFTSGSTGQPKGVGISHRALGVHALDYVDAFGLSASDCVYQFSTINFDASAEQIFPALAVGARLCMRGPGLPDWGALHDTLATQRVNVMYLPTAYWTQSIAQIEEPLPDLRLVTIGGEAVTPEAVRRWQTSALGRVRLVNTYGPTEATITCMLHETSPADAERTQVPIGLPLASRRAYVLDQDGREVPLHGIGELCVAGETLARGYLGRAGAGAGATAARFAPDPFAYGERVYRTGDVCRLLEGGVVEFLGRVDAQIKLRGYRIELGDIETALGRIDGVHEAMAALVPSARDGDARLVGYVVGDAAPAAISRALQASLPAYMVPSAIVVLDALPLLPNGKHDRRALPLPEDASPHEAAAPRTDLEAALLAIWQEVLHRNDLGITDDFFTWGGDSLAVLRVAAAAKRRAISNFTMEAMFVSRTVAALADHLERAAALPANIVRLNEGAASRNLFCVHPLYGTASAYAPLAAALTGVATVYGIQSPRYSDPTFRATSLEDLAREYVCRMRRVQPAGPYCILGWSLGGWIAAAMVRELERLGESVALVALVDTRAAIPAVATDRATLARSLTNAAFAGGGDRAEVERELRRCRRDEDAGDAAEQGEDANLFDVVLDVLVQHEELLARHTIASMRTDVRVWRATRSTHRHDPATSPAPSNAADPAPSWQSFTSAIAYEVDVDATHESIVTHERLLSDLRALLEAP